MNRIFLLSFLPFAFCLKIAAPASHAHILGNAHLKAFGADASSEISKCDVGSTDVNKIVESIALYFEDQKIVIYPFALSMVAAMRWGGVGVQLKSGAVSLEHDLDFLIVLPNKTSFNGTRQLVAGWQSHLKRTHNLESTEGTKETLAHPLINQGGVLRAWEFFHLLMVVQAATIVGEKWATDGILERTLDKIHSAFAGNSSTHFQISRDAALPQNSPNTVIETNHTWAEIRSAVLNDAHKSKWFRNNHTMVDFWFMVDAMYDKSYFPSHTNKTLFMGQVFDFPTIEVIYLNLMKTWKVNAYQQQMNTTDLCDFAMPRGLFEEDFDMSPEMFAVGNACKHMLTSKSFASFDYCKEP